MNDCLKFNMFALMCHFNFFVFMCYDDLNVKKKKCKQHSMDMVDLSLRQYIFVFIIFVF